MVDCCLACRVGLDAERINGVDVADCVADLSPFTWSTAVLITPTTAGAGL